MTHLPDNKNPLLQLGENARAAAAELSQAKTALKNKALALMSDGLRENKARILAANKKDMARAQDNGMPPAQMDRLMLNAERIDAIAESLATIIKLEDPVGKLLQSVMRPNGLKIEKVAVPIGVIGMIFESRPNVAVDAAALCMKSGNACILRGGSESWDSVAALVEVIRDALNKAKLSPDIVQIVPSPDRALVGAMLTLDSHIDLIVPRGGRSLVERVRTESRIAVLSHLEGICHTYIDAKADPVKAVSVTLNAKMRRPSICGATECLLLHKEIATTIGANVMFELLKAGCEVRVPAELMPLSPGFKQVAQHDYGYEFLAPIIAVAVVDDTKQAVEFINRYGSGHTDAILTEDKHAAEYFLTRVNSAIALHNASTQFADGGEFGMGCEMGIATGKLHARGPVGLEQLTTYQYRVYGDGQTRA
ncbi:MAG: glutamate-5-semialdehyde dehydrogenase [Bdellovibrionales bacterium]